jgi:NitT/TauT family transport system permease protein
VYPKILVAILIVFFPVLVNVLTGVRGVDPDLVNLARAFNAGRWQIFRMIEYPSALPPLFSGLRIAAYAAVVLAEARVLGYRPGTEYQMA